MLVTRMARPVLPWVMEMVGGAQLVQRVQGCLGSERGTAGRPVISVVGGCWNLASIGDLLAVDVMASTRSTDRSWRAPF